MPGCSYATASGTRLLLILGLLVAAESSNFDNHQAELFLWRSSLGIKLYLWPSILCSNARAPVASGTRLLLIPGLLVAAVLVDL